MGTPAAACKALLAEANRLHPNRSRASDGIMGDWAHQATQSDHNDGNAVDLTHDPANGCDAHKWVRELVARRDPRVKYAISNGQIWSKLRAGEGWRRYTGTNSHTKHAHVSIHWEDRDNCTSWFPPVPVPAPILLGDHMQFKDDNDRLAWQVEFAYTTLLGRSPEDLATLAWRMDQIRTDGYAQLWHDVANSDEAVSYRAA